MSCSAFTSGATRRTAGPQTNACRHCGSHITHWFTPPEASDEGAILLCARCGRVTTILVADGRRAAVCAALDILRQARPQRQALPRRQPEGPALFPQLTRQEAGLQAPRWITERRIGIGQDEVSLDKRALLIVFILVGMYGI